MHVQTRDVDEWRGVWVAGFCSIDRLHGRPVHYLAYLMRVSNTFLSHRDLWDQLSAEDRRVKSATLKVNGDVYKPKPGMTDPFDPSQYREPHRDHSHWSRDDRYGYSWYMDIKHRSRGGQRPVLLMAGADTSFVWRTPTLYTTYFADSGGYRGHRSMQGGAFLTALHER
jgi:hypothetical protein